MTFSGSSGSMPGFTSSKSIFEFKPLPPMKFLTIVSSSGCFVISFFVRSILRIASVHFILLFIYVKARLVDCIRFAQVGLQKLNSSIYIFQLCMKYKFLLYVENKTLVFTK
jgi:hypothetical protein